MHLLSWISNDLNDFLIREMYVSKKLDSIECHIDKQNAHLLLYVNVNIQNFLAL